MQVARIAKDNKMIREMTPVIQDWPWANGIPLHHGALEEFLRGHLSAGGPLGDIKDMVLVCCR